MVAIDILWVFLACLGSYFCGSIPTSVWLGRLATGKDLRQHNIGNPGAFNAYITYGPVIGLTTVFLEFFKGAIPIAIIDHVFSLDHFIAPDGTNIWHTLACILGPIFCVIGHNYTFWLKFRGGRGLAVFLGAIAYVNPLIFVIYFALTFFVAIGLLKFPTRIAHIFTFIFFLPAALFIPIGPPWTDILNDWVAGKGGFLHLTPMFIGLGMWIAWLPKHWRSIMLFLRGEKEWTFSVSEGQKLVGDFDGTAKDPGYLSETKQEEG